MASRRSPGGLGTVLGLLLLLGLIIQVVKLLVLPLTILAIGAAVGVPIYLVTKHRQTNTKDTLPPPAADPEPIDDGIVSQEAVLRLLNRPGFGAASFFEKDVDHAREEVPGRAA